MKTDSLQWAATMQPLVRKIEELFLEDLRRFASELRQQFPALMFNVWKWPSDTVKECTDFDLGIECRFPEVVEGNPDNVALIIELCFLNSTPRIMGSVVWGHPSGHPEAEFSHSHVTNAEWPEAKPEKIEELRGFFPTLVQSFKAAVERGIPTDAA
jgi:hypothetical protein